MWGHQGPGVLSAPLRPRCRQGIFASLWKNCSALSLFRYGEANRSSHRKEGLLLSSQEEEDMPHWGAAGEAPRLVKKQTE